MKALIAALTLAATPALSQSQCAGYADVAAGLSSQFGEEIIAQGGMDGGAKMETWANKSTGSWTVIVIRDDVACLAASGSTFTVKQAKPNA